ncbi:MAG: phosphoribosylamine--glycine ligase [Planctomycetes bacterium]|nr:phosphoribosylamine--glycine ligase [Planctomycetota bacterium]
MQVLVVGGGGREHALCWKIAQSPLVDRVHCAPGNAGIAEVADCRPVKDDDIPGLVALAKKDGIDLTVVGPEVPLCAGIVDAFEAEGLKIFGPSRDYARLEGDKAFARELCRRNRIPSPSFWTFEDFSQAKAFLENREEGPIVVKASGLAAGKGVTVAENREQAIEAARDSMEKKRFGDSGRRIVFEEFLEGEEVSLIALTDGTTILPLEPAQDHKQVFDGDEGPNTGGMGAYSPVPSVNHRVLSQIESQVLLPTVHGLRRSGEGYRGFLYAGLMMTHSGPRVLEFNCRLGDPETQPLLMRFQSDLVPYLLHTIDGTLAELEAPEWDPRTAVCVMATSGGYPGPYKTGMPILGLDGIETGPDLQIFHSGTSRRASDVLTAGGRVLAACALGENVAEARERAYSAIDRIDFLGKHVRRDIGARER